jgi:hypothetical protein
MSPGTKKVYLILHVNCPILLSDCNQIWIFLTDFHKSADRRTYRQEDGRTDMAKLIGVIHDYKKAPKTGFIERAVFIRDLELPFSAKFTTGTTKTCRLLVT